MFMMISTEMNEEEDDDTGEDVDGGIKDNDDDVDGVNTDFIFMMIKCNAIKKWKLKRNGMKWNWAFVVVIIIYVHILVILAKANPSQTLVNRHKQVNVINLPVA